MTRLRGSLIAAAVPLFLLSACAQPAGNGAAASPGIPESASATAPGGDELVLRAESYGGFVPPDRVVGRLPAVSVYGDGRVISEGPIPAIYPAPALPNLQVQTISAGLVQELLRQGLAAGVRTGTDFGQPNVADAPTTRVTVVTANGPQSVAVEALGEAQTDDPALTAGQRAARNTLSAYVKKLTGLQTASGMTLPVPYQPETVAVLARPWVDNGSGEPAAAKKAWPGPKLPGGYLNPDIKIGCVVVAGAEKDTVLAEAKTASQITPWTAGYDKWLVTFRPLLPDEAKGCAMLKSAR
ncbi:hypothetical protein ACWKSP_33310 [Micromonosporaceae bacterium Da 78-11]